MPLSSSVDEHSFRKLLSRNISLPLGMGALSAVFFIALITYLLSVIQWVGHTDRVLNNVNDAMKLSVDLETGMRGYLLSGDEHFLDPCITKQARYVIPQRPGYSIDMKPQSIADYEFPAGRFWNRHVG